jgi:adenine-specific DNA-methyltransferase
MNQAALAETADFFRADTSARLDPKRRSALGQFMTATPLARFLASLFENISGDICLLDPGAGVGSLTAAFVERLCHETTKPRSASLVCYEIEPLMIDYLQATLQAAEQQCSGAQIAAQTHVFEQDFILAHAGNGQASMFDAKPGADHEYSHVIMNPPYKKISAASRHREALRQAGIETSNLYTGFMFLAAQKLRPGGEMVAIIPRSFCNGPYFKPFRQKFLSMMALRHIHVFETRNTAFKDDDVLQENIIIHAIKDEEPTNVTITTSRVGDFEWDAAGQQCIAHDMTQRTVPYSVVVRTDDPEKFINIATNDLEQKIVERMANFTENLAGLGLAISTGPVVDFRLKDDLCAMPETGAVPLLYAAHFRSGTLEWPKQMKKPNAIRVSEDSRRWLWANIGHFVITKRFTSKEERRRVVASLYSSELPGDLVGFENHLNVFHEDQQGMPAALARGLFIYLNSSLVDRYFRQFNGHTQVNATDLRSLRYPSRETLIRMGTEAGDTALTQQQIDKIIEEELQHMTNGDNPLQGQNKIDEALEILKALGMPRGQQNERSALTLLALLDLKPAGAWHDLSQPLMGITPIMDYTREHYGREYAPNTRETFRRQTMHQFVEAGIALYNPDQPDRPVNSPKACYQVSDEAFAVIKNYGTDHWQETLDLYLEGQESLAAKWAKHREMQMVPVVLPEGKEIALTPGAHSDLIKQIITEFAPRFAPGSSVIYVGDTGAKVGHFEEELLADMGVTVDQHGKMPDVVLYYGDKDWLLLVESVTSHGPVDSKRHNELATLFKGAKPGLVYVTAFPDRGIMGRYLRDISWETEVWCADSPTHLIHFNGQRFLGPYEKS